MKFSTIYNLSVQTYRYPLLASGFGFACLFASVINVLNHVSALDSAHSVLPNMNSTPAPVPQNAVDFSQISQWHLLGHAKPALDPAGVAGAVPETQLQLKLLGILSVPEHPTSTRAFIEAEDQTQKAYRHHDTLPGGALLESIGKDKAVLLVDSRYEALTLKKLNSSPTETTPTSP